MPGGLRPSRQASWERWGIDWLMQLLHPSSSLGWGPTEALRQTSITLPLTALISLDPTPLEHANIYVRTF